MSAINANIHRFCYAVMCL